MGWLKTNQPWVTEWFRSRDWLTEGQRLYINQAAEFRKTLAHDAESHTMTNTTNPQPPLPTPAGNMLRPGMPLEKIYTAAQMMEYGDARAAHAVAQQPAPATQDSQQAEGLLGAQAVAEALREDAERYRLLRRGQCWSVVNGIGDVLRGDELDAAIALANGRGRA